MILKLKMGATLVITGTIFSLIMFFYIELQPTQYKATSIYMYTDYTGLKVNSITSVSDVNRVINIIKNEILINDSYCDGQNNMKIDINTEKINIIAKVEGGNESNIKICTLKIIERFIELRNNYVDEYLSLLNIEPINKNEKKFNSEGKIINILRSHDQIYSKVEKIDKNYKKILDAFIIGLALHILIRYIRRGR